MPPVHTTQPQDHAGRRVAWTRHVLAAPKATLEPASADASFRSYWRVHHAGATRILMDAPPEHEDVRPWIEIAARLANAEVPAPQVLASDADQGFVLMSDLGNTTLLPALSPQTVDALYGSALALLLRMQSRTDASGLPRYDEPRLVAEMELMPEWFLGRHLGFTPECEQWDTIEWAFRALVNAALEQPTVFVHRDYHSRNLMLDKDGTLATIDFQDAVLGPVTYDLVSLLRDCYIAWPQADVERWVEQHRRALESSGLVQAGAAQFLRWFDLIGLQRHLKVLGIFCRLYYRDGKDAYLRDLPLVWRYVREVGARHSDIAPLVALIEEVLGARDIRVPRDDTCAR